MKAYQAVRISVEGCPTYGDKYTRIWSEVDLKPNQIVEISGTKYIILFEEEWS